MLNQFVFETIVRLYTLIKKMIARKKLEWTRKLHLEKVPNNM